MTRTTQQLFNLTGKTALITGSAGGLGLQMAHALGEAGARIMLSDHHADKLEAAMTELHDAGIDARWVAANCAVAQDLDKLVNETLHRMGDVDILVNNAGSRWDTPALALPGDEWDREMALSVRSYFLLSQLVGTQSMIGRGGCIINVASHRNTLAGHTSQGAVIHFTRALACEWGPHGINVNAICPGGFANQRMTGVPAALDEERLATATPLTPRGKNEQLKGVTLLFASDAGKHITGQWLAVGAGDCAVKEA